MNAEAWIALAAVGLNIAVLAVGYGVMRGTVNAQGKRIDALEGDRNLLTDLRIAVGVIGDRQNGMIEQLRDLNASIRWMREPAGYDLQGVTPPQRTKP